MSPERGLDELFVKYRAACPEVELGANFMPELWQRIEARRGFWPVFEHLARVAVAVCLFACLVFAVLDIRGVRRAEPGVSEQSYAEALAADQSSETTFYADVVRPNGTADEGGR